MGSGMTENTAGCIWLGSVEREPSGGCKVPVAVGSIAAAAAGVRLWRCKSPEGGSLLAEVVVGGGGTGVGKGKNWEAAVRDCVHHRQAQTVDNTMTARVLDDYNLPLLGKSGQYLARETRETDTRVCE